MTASIIGSDAHAAGSYRSTQLQSMLSDWFISAAPNVMATLTFKTELGVRQSAAEKAFKRFSAKLTAELGNRYPGKQVLLIPVVENSREQLWRYGLTRYGREGTHIHALMKLPGDMDENRALVRKLWVKTSRVICGDPKVYCPNSNDWFIKLSTRDEQRTYIGYAVKHMQADCTGLLVDCLNIKPRMS